MDDTQVKLPAGFSLKSQLLVLQRRTYWGDINPGPGHPGCADCLLVTCAERVRDLLAVIACILNPTLFRRKTRCLNERLACFFLILALRIFFLGQSGGGDRKGRINMLNAQGASWCILWEGWSGGGFILIQADAFDFCRGHRRQWRLKII